MAVCNPKPPLIAIFVIFLFLLHKTNSESFSFKFTFSEPDPFPIALVGDAISYAELSSLREEIKSEIMSSSKKNSVGRAVYFTPIHLWDRFTGNVAKFTIEFTFMVDCGGLLVHSDSLAFFISPVQTALNSSMGYLGLFSPENAFNPSRNQVVAVELDSFGNTWDPIPEPLATHVGIDVKSLRSVNTTGWPINSVPRGSFGKARVLYDSKTEELSVTISYGTEGGTTVSVSQIIDLKSVLPEWVRIEFSVATGDLVESHDIVSWSFSSFFQSKKATEEDEEDLVLILCEI